jgi:predicted nuclease of predicted toxin-antitoxin system
VYWKDIGKAADPDIAILLHAQKVDAAIITADLDFMKMVKEWRLQRPSVVQLRCIDKLPETVGERVIKAIGDAAESLELGAFLSIENRSTRLKMLPNPEYLPQK